MSTRTAKPRAVRCVCKNRDRHFGVCKCHRHKGDTVSDLSLPLTPEPNAVVVDVITAAADEIQGTEPRTDVWWCATCKTEWTVPSLPHNPACPTCGAGGWWLRFV